MRRLLFCAVLPFLVLPLLGAGPPVSDPKQTSLTIYTSDANTTLVQDVRQIDIPAGRSRLEFKNVSSAIRSETVALSGQGLTVVEQNFDYDLLTPSKMMEKAVGQQIQIVRTIPGTGKETRETATVLSTNNGVILKIGERIEVLRDDGIPTRVIFNGVPENLRARPTLSVTVDSGNAGARDVTLRYLTTGLSWNADYVAQFDEKQETMALQGWVTIRNNIDTGFNNASVRLVAGNVGGRANINRFRSTANVRGGTAASAESDGSDFPIYSLPERVSVASNQSKQVSFLELTEVKARKRYEYRESSFYSQDRPAHAGVALTFSNASHALPKGTVRVYQKDSGGAPKFVGEEMIDETPAGSDLSVHLGDAFDITVQSTLVAQEDLSRTRKRYQMRYEFRNAGAQPVTVDFRHNGLRGEDSFDEESIKGARLNAFTQGWSVPVPAHGTTTLSFTLRQG